MFKVINKMTLNTRSLEIFFKSFTFVVSSFREVEGNMGGGGGGGEGGKNL